jgi:hypothetical protein
MGPRISMLGSGRMTVTTIQERAAYNRYMARGWESKSVEAQIEESVASGPAKSKAQLTAEELERRQKKADLMLSRSRIVQQLEESSNERYSDLLRRTLADLDAQIAELAP